MIREEKFKCGAILDLACPSVIPCSVFRNSVTISFPLNILRTNGQNLTKFCIHINIDKIQVGIVKRHFSQICNRVTALD